VQPRASRVAAGVPEEPVILGIKPACAVSAGIRNARANGKKLARLLVRTCPVTNQEQPEVGRILLNNPRVSEWLFPRADGLNHSHLLYVGPVLVVHQLEFTVVLSTNMENDSRFAIFQTDYIE